MIEFKNISKVYHLAGEDVYALDDVSCKIESREFVAIVGPSGSGKSTMMNIIGCLDSADSGNYFLDGQDIVTYSQRQLATMRNKKIGFVFQQFNLLQKMTAFENVELPLIYQGIGKKERRAAAKAALESVGLQDRIHHLPSQLSGGQQQRVAIARAIATKPSLILADEPTGNLDSKSGRDILNMLHSLHKEGNTIILITHDHSVAEEAQRRLHMMDGKITSDERSVAV